MVNSVAGGAKEGSANMEIQVFGIVLLVLGVLSLNLRYQWAIYFLALCCLFASSSTIAFPALGGMTIPPANLFLLFFAVRAFTIGGGTGLWRSMAPGSTGFPLFCLCVIAMVGAAFLPRAMAGSTYVYPISHATVDSNSLGPQPLGPVSGNLTQSIYFIGEVLVYSCMMVFLARKDSYKHFANAILVLSALNVIAAIVDLGSATVGVDVLNVIKTANYTMHDGEEVGGLRRIVGTFAEASAFSGFTLPLFAFSANLWLLSYRPRVTGLLTFMSGALLLLSTSATAYVGFTASMAILLLGRCSRIAPRSSLRKRHLCVVLICAGTMALLFAIVFKPALLQSMGDFFNDTVVAKADSDSGVERGSWNRQALTNFVESFGLGIGIGSSRTSSFVLVLLSNLGIVGTTFFCIFAWKCVITPMSTQAPKSDRIVCYASRQAMLTILAAASISATVFDLGPSFYMFAAAAGMLSSSHRRVLSSERLGDERERVPVERRQSSQPGIAVCQSETSAGSRLDGPKRESRIPAWPHRS